MNYEDELFRCDLEFVVFKDEQLLFQTGEWSVVDGCSNSRGTKRNVYIVHGNCADSVREIDGDYYCPGCDADVNEKALAMYRLITF